MKYEYENKISDLIYDDVTGNVYRRVVFSMLDIISIIYDELPEVCKFAFQYAFDYWYEGEKDKEGLLVERGKLALYLDENDLWYKDNKLSCKVKLVRCITRNFDPNNRDENCDTLYFFIEMCKKIGLTNELVKQKFYNYFPEI